MFHISKYSSSIKYRSHTHQRAELSRLTRRVKTDYPLYKVILTAHLKLEFDGSRSPQVAVCLPIKNLNVPLA